MSELVPSLSTATIVAIVGSVTYALYRRNANMSGAKTMELRGPARDSLLLGQTKAVWGTPEGRIVTEEWADEYGGVYRRPGPFGTNELIIVDPKAVGHVFSNSEEVYHVHPVARTALENMVGKGLIAADGEDHKRQRKNISPGFTSVKIREYTSIFFDCAHQLENKWTAELESKEEYITDVQKWFGALSLDTIGFAGFSHDFGSLSGRSSDVSAAFDGIATHQLGILDGILLFIQLAFPVIDSAPTPRQRAVDNLNKACGVIAKQVIAKAKVEEKGERSIMGLMIQAQTASSGIAVSETEVTAQIRTLIVAGYETTSATLSRILIELCRDAGLQKRVRAELLEAFPVQDPTYEALTNELPLLDALVHEVLRVLPPIPEAWRTARREDVVPLSMPIVLPNGKISDHVVIPKGQTIVVPLQVVNRSRQLWGEDAWEFKPERWMSDLPEHAQAVTSYRHLMTFLDGPKVCLGRGFAVANIKVALVVLLRKFSFELIDGPETKIVDVFTLVHRPKEEMVDGIKSKNSLVMRMRVRAVE